MEVESELREVKALASSTRIEILKKLSERNHTISELSRALNLSKPTVLHHMRILEDAGFIKRVEDGRKWVYYQLTERGKMILKLRRIKLVLSAMLFILPAALLLSFLNSLKMGAPIRKASEAVSYDLTSELGGFEISFELIFLLLFIISLLAYLLVRKKLKSLETS